MNTTPEQVKTVATVPAALSLYGHDPRGRRRIPCPIHGGRNLNFSFDEHAWHCFKCNRGGDVISFAQDLFGMSFRDALSKLAIDFGIEEERTDAAAKEYAETLKRFNERLAREKEAEREERRADGSRDTMRRNEKKRYCDGLKKSCGFADPDSREDSGNFFCRFN
jgi:hypothetical protein